MTGFMVPEVWCNDCGEREPADGETTLTALRANLADSGWCTHQYATVNTAEPGLLSDQDRREGLIDFCPDCDCPVCGEDR